jgi:hypothetical protein
LTYAVFKPFPVAPAMGVAMTTRQKRRFQFGVRGIVRYCRGNSGRRLVKSLADKRRVEFRLEPDGIRVRSHQAHVAIFSGELVRERDGFFGNSQSWVVKP